MTELAVQLAERDEIIEGALEAGVNPNLADQLARAGGEIRKPHEVIQTVAYLAMRRGREPVEGLADTDAQLRTTLLGSYSDIVTALVPDEAQRAEVIALWDDTQRPLVDEGYLQQALAS